jgi:hypothetical protein
MAPFATAVELEDFLQLESGTIKTATANLVLAIASGAIRSYVGWSISEETAELVTQGTGDNVIRLPTKLLTDVTSVEVDGDLLVFGDDFRWTTLGRLRRIGARWPRVEQTVEVTFVHGYNPVPDEVKGLCLSLAGRLYNNPEGLRAWSVDGLSETMAGPQATIGDVGSALTDFEKAVLDPFVLLDGAA